MTLINYRYNAGTEYQKSLINQSWIQHNNRQTQDLDSTLKIQVTSSEEEWCNKSIVTLLSGQQDLKKQLLDMMPNMTRQYEYGLFNDRHYYIWWINMDFADLLFKIEKVAALTTLKNMN